MQFLSLVTLTFDLWPWPSKSSKRGTRHVFPVNLAQIRSAVPEIFCTQTKQEGQHPLTGQRAANFRLLANQWAERRLVTQWRHGCRVMRRSVCNAGASNAGRSLCVQISRERSYPLPIYWYNSKGNWLRYNFAAGSFYIMLIFALDKVNIRRISTSGLVDLLT